MKSLQMHELVQEIEMVIDDWHKTKCPIEYYMKCNKDCAHYSLCSCLLQLSNIKVENYDGNGDLRK